jgi:hypothetical protein
MFYARCDGQFTHMSDLKEIKAWAYDAYCQTGGRDDSEVWWYDETVVSPGTWDGFFEDVSVLEPVCEYTY